MERVFIKTFGCRMNDYDSQRMAGALAEDGYIITEKEEEADVVIINTCSVRGHAEDRAMSHIGRYVKGKKVVVAGCMAQNLGAVLKKQFPKIFAVAGTLYFSEMGRILREGGVFTSGGTEEYKTVLRKGGVSGLITIMQGCDNYCSYCIVPYVRGRERSRPVKAIIEELKGMAGEGYKEAMFLGQNVNSYRDRESGADFTKLLLAACEVNGIERIRFMTSHPKDLNSRLIDAVAAEEKLCPHFHLPVQSGSDSVLKRMNRGYTAAEYLAKTSNIREKIKDVSITTDILIGFSGETEEDFLRTVELVEEVRFDSAYMFRYSVRKGTDAEKFPDDVPEEEKLRRLNYLLDLQKKIGEDVNRAYVGREFDVLVLGESEKDRAFMKGTTANNKRVYIGGVLAVPGVTVRAGLTELRGESFIGEIKK